MINNCINEIKYLLNQNIPPISQEEINRRNKILNSNNPKFMSFSIKMSVLEKISRQVHKKYNCSYDDALEVFKELICSDIHDEKFVAILFLNRSKKDFNASTIDLIREKYVMYCDTWALCDSTMIKVVGPFLGKIGNERLANDTIITWSKSKNLWIRRASMVILLKLIMLKKDFNEKQVFDLVDKMLAFPEDYIQKGIGWLLKTCSNYKPDVIINYLSKNKIRLTRLILRYASEKLPREIKNKILNT